MTDLRLAGEFLLRDAADQAELFDPELSDTLRDMAKDYAGPIAAGQRCLACLSAPCGICGAPAGQACAHDCGDPSIAHHTPEGLTP